MQSMFARRSGRLWCEGVVDLETPSFPDWEEPFSVWSSLWISAVTTLGWVVDPSYARFRPEVVWVAATLGVVGLGSAFYHATLSLAGQLVDEAAILWALMAVVWVWLPGLPSAHRPRLEAPLRRAVVLLCPALTLGLLLSPRLNCFILLSFAAPLLVSAHHIMKELDAQALRLAWASIGTFFLSVVFWSLDEVTCLHFTNLGLPYLHGLWHMGMGASAYGITLLVAYSDARRQGRQARLYWLFRCYPLIHVQ